MLRSTLSERKAVSSTAMRRIDGKEEARRLFLMLIAHCRDRQHGDRGRRSLLRFLACGSVDDGKSTLIGRLLHDAGLILDDQLAALPSGSRQIRHHRAKRSTSRCCSTGSRLNASRASPSTSPTAISRRLTLVHRRRYARPRAIHRNMATGASNAELAIILVDARKGVLVQTRRHSAICSLFGVRDSFWRSTKWTWPASSRRYSNRSPRISAPSQSARLPYVVRFRIAPLR